MYSPLIILSLLKLLPISILSQHVIFECSRMVPTFCCTSRVRSLCQEQCAAISCDQSGIQHLFSTDERTKSVPRDGNAHHVQGGARGDNVDVSGSALIEGGGVDAVAPPPPPPPPPFPSPTFEVPQPSATGLQHRAPPPQGPFGTIGSFGAPPPGQFGPPPPPGSFGAFPSEDRQVKGSTRFPTLIPESQIQMTTLPPTTTTAGRVNSVQPSRRRTTPDPRIIKPPESLVIIGDYDEDGPSENAVVAEIDSSSPRPSGLAPGIAPDFSKFSAGSFNQGPTQVFPTQAPFVPNPKDEFAKREIGGAHSGVAAVREQTLECAISSGKLRCKKARKKPFFIRRKTFSSTNLFLPPWVPRAKRTKKRPKNNFRKYSKRPRPFWRASVVPRQEELGNLPESAKSLSAMSNNGEATETAKITKAASRLNNAIESIINNFSFSPSPSKNGENLRERSRGTEFESKVPEIGGLEKLTDKWDKSELTPAFARTTISPEEAAQLPRRVVSPHPRFITPPPPVQTASIPAITLPPPFVPSSPRPTMGTTAPSRLQFECGVAPNFYPCVSSEVASQALLRCCQQKNLPVGCHHLCRYDITQGEVRQALDRGQCGIFNVAPFLECAAQGRDNTECCKHRGVAAKSGPQCEQFCRPSGGLTALGLQHVVCGNAIGEMLQCHHSGIRV